MKKLAKETAIYGVSSILGKFLNWMLVPLYTYVLESSAEYGIVTNLYAWTALLLVILTTASNENITPARQHMAIRARKFLCTTTFW